MTDLSTNFFISVMVEVANGTAIGKEYRVVTAGSQPYSAVSHNRGVGKGGSKAAVAPLDLKAIHCFSIV